MTLLWPN